ncbi:hypothetical protein HMPREF3039_03309 [Akkermansia sp. KLE1798]|nr:hypothetical protein HMPREF3039_03309 [Akkermansia sp. KLE1798]KZA03312.1 hypothetical protein HMPREF1326_03031 [Akkermansia sp. KLE1605]
MFLNVSMGKKSCCLNGFSRADVFGPVHGLSVRENLWIHASGRRFSDCHRGRWLRILRLQGRGGSCKFNPISQYFHSNYD